MLIEAGAKRRNTCVWSKSVAAPKFQGDGPANAAEAIVTAWCGKGRSVWNAGGALGHYHYPVDLRDRRHETQKPLPLLCQLILDFTMPGDIILDPVAGGAATLLAAKSLERCYIGYERDPKPHAKGLEALRTVKIQTHMQQLMLHKRRRSRAYAGARLKQIAMLTQTGLSHMDRKKKRRARSLFDLPKRRARSLDGM